MDVTLITGFLGAGKTTLVKRLLREYGATMKIGVIVNDLSELEVDGELIRMGHAVSEKEGNLVSITEGSISDTRRPEFANALAQMIDAGMEHIFVETSGASHPSSIIEELTGCPYAMLRSVVCLVDGRALWHDYEGGRGLVAIMKDEPNPGDENADHLLMIQLRSASVIAMTKTDLLGSVELEELLHALQKINPSAKLTTCTFGKIDPRVLFQNSPFDLTANLPAPVLGADFGIGSTVVRDLRPLHPQRFYDLYRDKLGLGIFRSKGFIWLASRPDQVLLWNQAGGAMGLELLGTWRVVVAEDPKLLPEEREGLRKLLQSADPTFGDRGNELTIIGQERDRVIFVAELKECFCTPAEVKQWLGGDTFPDPWPKGHRRLA
jgi:G3E family GTPase